MKKHAVIATTALAAVGLAAGIAQAAPDVTSVEVHRTGRHKVEVVVQAAHGTTLAAPRISATIGSRTRTARAVNWVSGAPATDSVQFVARFRHLRLGVGSVAAVTIDACDTTCTTVTKDVIVVRGTSTDNRGGNHPEDNPPAPLPAGSVTIDQAVSAALASVGPGSTLILVRREDDPGVAYEVKVAADGTVVSSHVEKHADR